MMGNEMITIKNDIAQSHSEYYSVSHAKFIKLYVLTLGLYSIYWFYKNWKLQQPYLSKKINPPLRSIFYIFYVHSLVKRISNSLEAVGKVAHNTHLNSYATGFIVLSIGGNIVLKIAEVYENSPYLNFIGFCIYIFSAYPLGEIQDKVNILKEDPLGEINSKYSWHNYVFMIVGGLLLALSILGFLAMMLMSHPK